MQFYNISWTILFFTNSKSQQLIHVFLRLSCHGLSPLIISERQLEPLVVMATMQRDMWKGSQDTCAHML